MNLQMRHRRLIKEHADPADELDFQALKMALQILVVVAVCLLVILTSGSVEPAVMAPGASDQPRNHAAIQHLTPNPGYAHAQG